MEKQTWAELRDAGQQHFRAQEYAEAAMCFRKATDIQPGSAESWRSLGFALNACAQYNEAVGAFQSSIGLDPNNAEGYFGVGMAYESNADYDRAINSLDEALKYKPNHTAAKNTLVNSLLRNADAKLALKDVHAAEQCLDRAYKLARNQDATVIPYVQYLIVAQHHKKAFTIIRAARADAPASEKIKLLEEQMERDPKLAHAKQIVAVRAKPKIGVQAQKPTHNPDEINCPCGAAKVMKWATMCPTCNQRIGDPNARASQFAGHEDLKGYTWIDVCYYVLASLWLLWGIASLLIGLFSDGFMSGYMIVIGAVNAGVALGLLFQVEAIQFIGKILMILNFLGGSWRFVLGFAIGDPITIILGLLYAALAGFFWWLIAQLSE